MSNVGKMEEVEDKTVKVDWSRCVGSVEERREERKKGRKEGEKSSCLQL